MKPFLKLYSEYSRNEVESFLKELDCVKAIKDPVFWFFPFDEEIRVDASKKEVDISGRPFTPHEHFSTRWVYGMMSGKDLVVDRFDYSDNNVILEGYTIMHNKECEDIHVSVNKDGSYNFKILEWNEEKQSYEYKPLIDDWYIHAFADYKKEFLDE